MASFSHIVAEGRQAVFVVGNSRGLVLGVERGFPADRIERPRRIEIHQVGIGKAAGAEVDGGDDGRLAKKIIRGDLHVAVFGGPVGGRLVVVGLPIGDRIPGMDVVVRGVELATAYSELVDPVVQRERLTAQSLLAAGGDPEAMQLDEDFLLALEHAMPPTGGMGMGIDRLMIMLTGENIRETILFPFVRPEA